MYCMSNSQGSVYTLLVSVFHRFKVKNTIEERIGSEIVVAEVVVVGFSVVVVGFSVVDVDLSFSSVGVETGVPSGLGVVKVEEVVDVTVSKLSGRLLHGS